MILYFLLGLFVSSTIFLTIFIIWFTKKDKVLNTLSNDYEELKKLNPDESIDKSDFYR